MNTVKKKVIASNIDNIEKIMGYLKGMMIPRDYEKIMDSTPMVEGVVFFNHEFGPDKLKRAYARYTYLFLNLMEECGRLYRIYKNQPENMSVRLSPVGSMLCTLAVLEFKDVAFDGVLDKKEAGKLVNEIIAQFLPHVDLGPHIKRSMREHYDKFLVNGVYVSRINKLKMDVIDQGRKPLYVVR